MDLKEKIRVIEKKKKKGISFKDITTLIKDPEALRYTINRMVTAIDEHIDLVRMGAPNLRLFWNGRPRPSCGLEVHRHLLPHFRNG